MSMSIARFGFYLCILGLVAAHFEREGLTCKANGEYCQMHSDCCSRKCMTYLNVCARRIDEGFSPEIPHQSNSIYDIDVKQSAKEFPDIVDIVTLATESKQTPQTEQGRQCQPVGGQCSVGEECCTKRCHSYAHKCVT